MLKSTEPRLRLEIVAEVTVVSFSDPKLLDEEVIFEVGEELFRLVDDQGVTKLLLNFRDVQYMSSTMISQLVRLQRKVDKSQGKLKLCGLIPSLREVFRTSHLDRLLQIHADEHAALDSF